MKSKTKARLPALPQKLIAKDIEKIERRGLELTQWLQEVVNERMFHGQALFSFVGLPKALYNEYLSSHPLSFLYSDIDFKIAIPSFESVKSEDNKDSFVLFKITVKIISRKLQEINASYDLKRRYREFKSMHMLLKKKFKKYNKPLPELPRKIHFGNQVKRQYKLENYLRLLINYPDIFDCFCVRKFFTIEPAKFNEFKIRGTNLTGLTQGNGSNFMKM
jgi:hypothetical protein